MTLPRPGSFVIPQSEADEAAYGPLTIKLAEPELVAEGLYLQTWASSEVLARQLYKLPVTIPEAVRSGADVSTVPVLELGAGTGLVGLAAARIWKAPVILTELAPIVPGLAQNISLNAGALSAPSAGGAPLLCGALDWQKPEILDIDEKSKTAGAPDYTAAKRAHVLIASDTIYSEDHPEMLANVIMHWLSKESPDACAVIGYAMRVSYLDYIRELWERLESAGLEAVEEGRDNADEKMFDDECLIEWSVWRWKEAKKE